MTRKKAKKGQNRKPTQVSTEMNGTMDIPAGEGSDQFDEAFRRGTQLLHQGKAQESVPYLEQAYRIKPDNVDVAINLGGAYILAKKFSKAVSTLEPASQSWPEHSRIWINLGAAYLGNPVLARGNDQNRAIAAFERALEIDPIAPSVAYNIGLIYRDKGEVDKAMHWFHQAVKHNPNDKDARRLLMRLETEQSKENDEQR